MAARSIVIEIDAETEARLRRQADKKGVTLSQYITELLRHRALIEWPEDLLCFAGTWTDFPDPEELRASLTKQSPREAL
ncbi:MAG: hypothetical protein KatS3mg023_0655 [Armatimonadota bacterium]|nr:MAG: hypothetical protein KatS3mg023_0655 [Armatimonadota bacterium]